MGPISRATSLESCGRRAGGVSRVALLWVLVGVTSAVMAVGALQHVWSDRGQVSGSSPAGDRGGDAGWLKGEPVQESACESDGCPGHGERPVSPVPGQAAPAGVGDQHLGGAAPAESRGDVVGEVVARLVAEGRFVDLHADTILRAARRRQDLDTEYPGAEVDIPKLRRAGVGLTFFAVCSPRPRLRPGFRTWEDFAFIRYFKHVVATHEGIEQALSASDARRIRAEGKIPVVLSLEGAGILLEDPGRLQTLYDAGMRAIGPVWNITNTLADAARDEPRWGGLSPVGRRAVLEMNRLGIMVDVSHASENAFWDIIETSKSPVYASHSNAYALRAHPRNLKDEQIRAIAKRGGVIGVAFHRTFLKRGRGPATIDDVVAHVRHIAAVGGVSSVAIGTDFGGGAILPAGLGDMGRLPDLVKALLESGFSEQDVRAIMGGNAMRYFETICP